MAESPAPAPVRLRDRSATEALIVGAGERILLRDGFPGLDDEGLGGGAVAQAGGGGRRFGHADRM